MSFHVSSQRCERWYFGWFSKWISVCVCVCTHVLLWGPNIPEWDSSHRFAQRTKCHILSVLLRTTPHSPVNWCRCVNVELKTIKTTLQDKETFEATEVCSFYLKLRGGKCLGRVSLCVQIIFSSSMILPFGFSSTEHLTMWVTISHGGRRVCFINHY